MVVLILTTFGNRLDRQNNTNSTSTTTFKRFMESWFLLGDCICSYIIIIFDSDLKKAKEVASKSSTATNPTNLMHITLNIIKASLRNQHFKQDNNREQAKKSSKQAETIPRYITKAEGFSANFGQNINCFRMFAKVKRELGLGIVSAVQEALSVIVCLLRWFFGLFAVIVLLEMLAAQWSFDDIQGDMQ